MTDPIDDATRRKNRRLAVVLGLIALAIMASSVPFWQKLIAAATQ